MALQLLQLPSSFSSSSLLLPPPAPPAAASTTSASFLNNQKHPTTTILLRRRRKRNGGGVVFVNVSNSKQQEEEDTTTTTTTTQLFSQTSSTTSTSSSSSNEEQDQLEYDAPSQYISQIKKVLELLKKNRDMTFNEVKLTVMIEDPRDVERRRLLGIDDEDAPTRDDLAAALEQVNEGNIPENPIALQMLAEEMIAWPNLEVEVSKQKMPARSLYARFTDTGIDPKEAAKRLNVDWDSAAEIEDVGDGDDVDVPAAVGFGALYLVSAFPIIIGVSVVLILFYNSLQ